MPGLPEGAPAPRDGSLPSTALDGLGKRPFGVYVHVPFCATRCGYCDFNTYISRELGGGGSQEAYADTALRELRLARTVLDAGGNTVPAADTVFFGGGTPTLLPVADVAKLLQGIRDELGLAVGAEVTAEANPESVDERYLVALKAAGFTRISFGMQSARSHVLRLLDRQHSAGAVDAAVSAARRAGFNEISLDLIYGTPGESLEDWRFSIETALGLGPDHVSAYALVVEPGTRLAARVGRGELPLPDDDDVADKYLLADETLAAAGYRWYELSNWALPGAECRHNVGYWRGYDWWGIGPGAHSHVGGTRWWNVKHPATYAARLSAGESPAHAREVLDQSDRRIERILLGIRLADGHPVADLPSTGRAAAERAAADGLLAPAALRTGRAVLTPRGRLLADAVVRDLVG